jgi:RND family efflux transporter MFP subunit
MKRIALPLILLALLAACKEDEQPAEALPRPVKSMLVTPIALADDRSAIGEIAPRREAAHAFRVSAKLTTLAVDVGAEVQAGDVLARLDDEEFLERRASAQADLAKAQAILVEADAAFARMNELLHKGLTTRVNFDAARKTLDSAKAGVASAIAALALAEAQLGYTTLTAEFDGIVTATSVEIGQVVAAGQTVLTLADGGAADAVFWLPESGFADFRPGAPAPAVIVSLLSDPSVTAKGALREIAPSADPQTGTYEVRIALRDVPGQMRFGAAVSARLDVPPVQAIVVPGAALTDLQGTPAVWVVAANAVHLRAVTVIRYETDRVLLGGGVAPGERIVIAGAHRLRENQEVRIEGAAE